MQSTYLLAMRCSPVDYRSLFEVLEPETVRGTTVARVDANLPHLPRFRASKKNQQLVSSILSKHEGAESFSEHRLSRARYELRMEYLLASFAK